MMGLEIASVDSQYNFGHLKFQVYLNCLIESIG